MKLLFIYNVKSGKMHAAFDSAHKILSPRTYQCHLCVLTHGTFSERNAWTAFRQEQLVDMEFLHKDEFESLWPQAQRFRYPTILTQTNSELAVFMSTEDIQAVEHSSALIKSIKEKLARTR